MRQFWWFAGVIPLFGIIAFAFGGQSLLRGIGLFAILWPLTIPARAALATDKVGKTLSTPTVLIAEGDSLYFQGENGQGFRLRLDSVRQIVSRKGFYILRLRRMGFVPVPESALEEPKLRELFEHVATPGQRPSSSAIS